MAEVMSPVAASKAGSAKVPVSAAAVHKEREHAPARGAGVLPENPWAIPVTYEGSGGVGAPPSESTVIPQLPRRLWNTPTEAPTAHWVNVSPGNRLPLQCKLAVGPVNDPLEAEADAMADRVMRGERVSTASPASSAVHRKCACEGSGQSCEACQADQESRLQRKAAGAVTPVEAPPMVYEVLRSSGQPLDRATRAFFEPRFGSDLGGVRVHTDTHAAESARRIDAVAYTVGRNVVFGPGQYAPQSNSGKQLLAHELSHVLQQSNGIKPGSVVQRKSVKVAGCGLLNLAASILDIGSAAHIQIQGFLAAKGVEPEFEIPRGTKLQLGWGCRKLGTPYGAADLARRSGLGFDLGEIKPVTAAGRVRAKLEVGHYRRRATQSLQRLFRFGTCGRVWPGPDDLGFAATNGLTPASGFSLLSGVLSGDQTIGPFSGDPSLTLKAKEISPGAVCYWCTKDSSQQSQKPKPPGPSVGFGVSIGGSTGGAYNAGVGVAIMSDSTAYATAGAGISYKSDTKAAGAVGAGASVESDSAAAGAAGAGLTKDTQSVGVGVAGAGESKGSISAGAGAASAGTSQDTASAGAGVAGRGSVKDSAVAGAGAAGSGKLEGVSGAGTGSPGKPVEAKDVEGGGKSATPPPPGADTKTSAQEQGQPGTGTGTGAGQSPAGKGDQAHPGTSAQPGASAHPGSQGGGSGQGGQKGTAPGEAGAGGTESGTAPGKDASESAAAKGAQGAREAGQDSGTGGDSTTASTGAGKGTPGGGTAKVVGGLGVMPIAGSAASDADRQRAEQEAGKVAALLANASAAQVALFRSLAQSSPDGAFVVPASQWVDTMMKATQGLSEDDLKYLNSLNWTPAHITPEELRKKILAALKANKPPTSAGDPSKGGGGDAGKHKADAGKSHTGGAGTTAKGTQTAGEGAGKGTKHGPALSGFVTPRKYAGNIPKVDPTGFHVQPSSQITMRTRKGARVTLEVRWDEGGALHRARVEYEIMADPVLDTDPNSKKQMWRFDLQSTNTEPLLLSPEGAADPTVLPPRAPAYYGIPKK